MASIARDPLWFPYRYDPTHDAFHFRHLSRADHRGATFLTDEYLGEAAPVIVRRADVMAQSLAAAPLHVIVHSAFCCSTVLARAFDAEGAAMGLKEPMFFNDMAGWQMRGADPARLQAVMQDGLRLLARPFAAGRGGGHQAFEHRQRHGAGDAGVARGGAGTAAGSAAAGFPQLHRPQGHVGAVVGAGPGAEAAARRAAPLWVQAR